jgi:hypothetical protein
MASLKTPKCSKKISECGTFSIQSRNSFYSKFLHFFWYLREALDEIGNVWNSEGFVWKLFARKIFEKKFQCLHHCDMWLKLWVKAYQINGWSFAKVRWHCGSDVSRPVVELFWSIVMLN